MLLESSFFGDVVDRLETQLLALTQEISATKDPAQAPAKEEEAKGWQQPQLDIFNVRRGLCVLSVLGFLSCLCLGCFAVCAWCELCRLGVSCVRLACDDALGISCVRFV